MQQEKLVIQSAPHIHSSMTTQKIMFYVISALVPAAAAGVFYFGLRALMHLLISILLAVLTEAVVQKLMHQPITIRDGSAILTGLLIGMNLPVAAPLWIGGVGSVFAIALVKQAFGGLGHNFMNPALAARAMMLASWPSFMTNWTTPFDGLATATPLAILKAGIPNTTALPTYWDMFIGNIGGCIGETSALALLLGGVFLIYKEVIDYRIPLAYIGTVYIFGSIFGADGLNSGLFYLLAGGMMLGSIFMATDYVSSPATARGRWIYGIGCGLITMLIRLWGSYPEGVSFSILLMNIAAPLIERFTIPKKFGEVSKKNAK
ncbi:MAG TPA: RnfABCDGE type electron transport complex subunit D [Bacillota bacterium]|nr:RnfABCDGE type electron transport complex subunit D [Bacillota bacterium]